VSIRAIDWIFRQDIKPSSDKFVLLALADNCNDTGMAYPSIETICRKTNQNRKTVLVALQRLVAKNRIRDTGKRAGATKSIVVYELAFGREREPGNGSSPKNGHAQAVPILREAVPILREAVPNLPREPSGTVRKPDGVAEVADRLGAIFHRKLTTPWSDREIKAFKAILPIDETELLMLERYYRAERGHKDNICRRDLPTLLNNYRGEIDRALAYCERHPLSGRRAVRMVPVTPAQTEEEIRRSQDIAKEAVQKLREQFRKSRECWRGRYG